MLPMFNNTDKFDSTNWSTQSNNILSIVSLKEITGYLNSMTTKPIITTSMLTTETPWNFPNPSRDEQDARNAWTKILITFNTKNPVGLGININSTTAKAWKTYKDSYEITLDMARQNIEQELYNLTFSDRDDFQNYVIIMQNKLFQTRALDTDITDKNFKTILLNSLLSSQDPVIASLYKDIPISKTIFQLQVWWLRISQNCFINLPRSITALQTNTYNPKDYPQVVCANPNCRQHDHTIEVCYWLEEEKKSQFPPSFGQREGTRGTEINTQQGGYRP